MKYSWMGMTELIHRGGDIRVIFVVVYVFLYVYCMYVQYVCMLLIIFVHKTRDCENRYFFVW